MKSPIRKMIEYITGASSLPWQLLNGPFISLCHSVPLLISLMLQTPILRKLEEMGISVLATEQQGNVGRKARDSGLKSWGDMMAGSPVRSSDGLEV